MRIAAANQQQDGNANTNRTQFCAALMGMHWKGKMENKKGLVYFPFKKITINQK